MKGLCLKQPYASWVANGTKTIETRTWQTKFRGRFLIVASKGTDLLFEIIGSDNLGQDYRDDWPLGMAIAEATLTDCRPMTEEDEKAAHCKLYDGAWAWLLCNIQRIDPFPVKGQLSFFEVPYCKGQQLLSGVHVSGKETTK